VAAPHINQYQLARRAEVHERIVLDIFDVIAACMEEGVEVRVKGFGVFAPEILPQRTVRSPLIPDGKKVVGRRRVIRFRLSRRLKKEWTSEIVTDAEDTTDGE
jgi:nucleoid DNA-binding protein